jgi:hypothetical protein
MMIKRYVPPKCRFLQEPHSTTSQKMIFLKNNHEDLITSYVRFEVFMVVAMKNAIFRDVTPCGSCKNRCFVGMYHPHHHGGKNH